MAERRAAALSVVIPTVGGHRYIAQCLSSLAKQRERETAEVIVVDGSRDDDVAGRVAREFSFARVVRCPHRPSIPELRSIGIGRATGDIVVTTAEHCVFEENWYERILAAHRRYADAAIGGAVESGGRRGLVDAAAYLCEYAPFMLPFPAAPAKDLPGPNVSYKRAVLTSVCPDLLERGVWEHALHARLRSHGMTLRMEPSIIAYHGKTFTLVDFVTQRYYFGRSFAAQRVAAARTRTRALCVGGAFFVPLLILWRYARSVLAKRRPVRHLVTTLPLAAVFAVAWSVGELFGYAFGDGEASTRVT